MLSTLRDSSPESLAAIAAEKKLRMTTSLVLLFTMGSQFDHLIVQELAKIGVFCMVANPASVTAKDVRKIAPNGIIVSGGPASVHSEPPPFDGKIFDLGIPVLGICLGFQMWVKHIGMQVISGQKGEFHPTSFRKHGDDLLFRGIKGTTTVLQSHGDMVSSAEGPEFVWLGSTEHAPIAAGRWRHLRGVQYHPEVTDTEHGGQLFENFCGLICGIEDRFPAHSVAEMKIKALKEEIGDGKVLLALSGGSDSSVLAHILRYATGENRLRLRGVYIKGIDRPDDERDALRFFGNQPWIEMFVVDATEEFLQAYKGITAAHDKRVAMRGVYKDVLEREIQKFSADFIAQGTLYTDLVESGHGHETGARRARIKLHHNTGLDFSVPELMPLSDCVKDNARDIGRDIGVPEELLVRHPFPGPGLTLRVEGEITEETLRIAREADRILMEEIHAAGLYEEIWQAGAVVTTALHTTTKGDDAGVGRIIMFMAVSSVNGFTSRPFPMSFDVQVRIGERMGSEIRECGAASYRVTGKPFSTIEAQ